MRRGVLALPRLTPFARRSPLAAGLAGWLAVTLIVAAAPVCSMFDDDFDGKALDERRWEVFRENDFRESAADVIKGRLRLQASTLGTLDDTVKVVGVRSKASFDLSAGATILCEIDWNNQTNGCYLTAGILLCAADAGGVWSSQEDWLKVEYVGVPPGRNTRMLVAVRSRGLEKHLHTEGWPDKQRVGRHIGRQRIRLVVSGKTIEVWENGTRLVRHDGVTLPFARACLCLQMTSHSNYPAREVFFDNVRVEVERLKE